MQYGTYTRLAVWNGFQGKLRAKIELVKPDKALASLLSSRFTASARPPPHEREAHTVHMEIPPEPIRL